MRAALEPPALAARPASPVLAVLLRLVPAILTRGAAAVSAFIARVSAWVLLPTNPYVAVCRSIQQRNCG